MAEETKVEEITKEYSAVEQEALAQGWVPKEEFDGDPDRYIDAPEFVRRGELFSKIEQQSKALKQATKAINDLAAHNAKVEAAAYDRARKELLAEKKMALAEADADKVVEIDEHLDLLKEQRKTTQQQTMQQIETDVVHPELQQWIGQNSWYESSRAMRHWADERGTELGAEGKSPREVLQQLAKEVKTEFPNKFKNPNRDRPGVVEGGARTGSGKSSGEAYDLTDVERQVMNTLVKSGTLTKEDYIAQLKLAKGDR